ncbi:hypothetical protein SAMN05421810_103208 [Amycolatopsis arida]|uniref:NB-ARC domain-containing protein n=1 Tax=Amycolatopsis arida TaxID=587909 RepID=A0A1I5SNB8_9PSEU|nr:ATP-binding protein [Amycolatopsis arida]TDX96412.1 hypothetical protein CLV69_103550 [Amycolatopsis arida]SFP72284.1 hypothetical protein SAMN05421810_103208 [Amycolatopsis arida]
MGEHVPDMSNRFDGEAHTVFQARDVHGDVHTHYHVPERPVPPPRMVLPPPAHYTNNEPQLAKLDDILLRAGDGPCVAVIRGAPGSGRSSLATTWVHHHRDRYADGHLVVRLGGGGADRTREALRELLTWHGFAESQIPASLDGRVAVWQSFTAGKAIALIIDDAVLASQVVPLLPGPGPSAVLVVEAGQLRGLRARVSTAEVTIDPLSDDSARLLLGRMAGADRVAAEPDAVTTLVDLCGGSAAALCVVGAMLAEFPDRPIARLATKLARAERALPELSRDEDFSLTVVFDAAHDRLPPLAQRCYQVLGVHPGGGDVALDTVAAALGESPDEVDDALRVLLRAMLVVETTEDRYLVSGLIRQHARAAAGVNAESLRAAIVRHYHRRAVAASRAWMPRRGWFEAIWPNLDIGPGGFGEHTARRWMEAERANLRAAVEAAYRAGEHERVCQLGVALWPLHDQGKFADDMAATAEMGVAAARELGSDVGAAVLGCQLGFAYRQRERFDEAAERFAAAEEAARRSGSLEAEATAVESLGLVRLDQGRRAEAAELLGRNLALAERIGGERRLAMARFHLAKVEPVAEAVALLDLARAGLLASNGNEGYTLTKIALWRGRKLIEDPSRLAEAADALADAAAAADAGAWHLERAQVCTALADLALARGEPEVARTHLRDALDIYRLRGFTAQAAAVEARLAAE